MSRLSSAFARAANDGRAALVTFVTGGDPTPADTGAVLDALVAGGADVIELGMPFTDPMADGPAIQQANLRAMAAGITTASIFAIAQRCIMLDRDAKGVIALGRPTELRDSSRDPRVVAFFNRKPAVSEAVV